MDINELLKEQVNFGGINGTEERFSKMLKRAHEELMLHPDEGCADILSDWIPILESVVETIKGMRVQ